MFADDRGKLSKFGKYFENYYCANKMSWAYCYRLYSGINTNMHLESMHKVLKYIYLEGRKVKRLDKAVHAILNFIRDRLITLNRDSSISWNMCKHVHLLGMFLKGQLSTIEEREDIGDMVIDCDPRTVEENIILKSLKNPLSNESHDLNNNVDAAKSNTIRLFNEIMSMVTTVEESKFVEKALLPLPHVLSSKSYGSNVFINTDFCQREPSNKHIEPQRGKKRKNALGNTNQLSEDSERKTENKYLTFSEKSVEAAKTWHELEEKKKKEYRVLCANNSATVKTTLHNGPQHLCSICGRNFKAACRLRFHSKTCGSMNLECPTCQKLFKTPEGIQKHQRFVHNKERLISCPKCIKQFICPADLKAHFNIHEGVRFKCDHCDSTFSNISNKKKHIKKYH
ncbi:unnamed protein product [Brassicogethes aeneus]|uniref:C2H2-type domain-containing protein n=1 Tax=Brassicogethes aeneus TaxID=1431903 RepID=A0A9P0FG17_BRAAE|nr:unnamed protein product [Brassicogethes aeneus]